jgi:threonyl-tRNA synthetase
MHRANKPGEPLEITLPDGTVRRFEGPISGDRLAAAIGPGLAKAAIATRIDGVLRDLKTPIAQNARVAIVTRDDPADDVLDLLRHDAAHVLAEAVQELYPGTQITFGPATADGFYYDFVRDQPFSPEDLERIEARMREIVARDEPIVREIWDRAEAQRWFREKGESYKAEWIGELPADAEISIYRQGDWLDLCTGPHLPSTGKLGTAFKLMKVSGAYWRGDPRNQQLQRIYGTAWRSGKELDQYLHRLAEAERRDHRRLGREMDLFHFQEEAPGMVFWHPKGWMLYRTLEEFIRGRLGQAGYVEVRTPELVDRKLWEASGHWEKFREHMFVAEHEAAVKHYGADPETRIFALKPMNCPCHVQIFNQRLKSYRELPLRMAEFGACHRYEPAGALHGLMRLRQFIQDDAHIFCREDQITDEAIAFCDLVRGVYRDLGFAEVSVRYANRPTLRVGSEAAWDKAESALQQALGAAGLAYSVNPGEGAFYGPKLEYVLRDAIGRDWQCGTLQVDFVLPERLDASYIGEDGAKHRPVMLHRAILGSLERFIGILIEDRAGKLPIWLAPVQAVVATISEQADDYARTVTSRLRAEGLRAEPDLRNEKIAYKVREHSLAKVPVLLVVGAREAAERTVSLRWLGGEKQETVALAQAIATLTAKARVPGA